MHQKVIEHIKYSLESHNVDFKKEQYPLGKHAKKHEFLKDIMAMANHPSKDEKYIIVGVKIKSDGSKELYNTDKIIDDSNYQQYVSANIEPKIEFEFYSFNYDGFNLGYFKISNNENRPYLFKRNISNAQTNKLEQKIGSGLIRAGSSTRNLARDDFENIYKSKYQSIDRKSDITIIPKTSTSPTDEFTDLNLQYFDIDILNHSNKSIGLEIEMIVEKNKTLKIIFEEDLLKEFDKIRQEESSKSSYFAQPIVGTPRIPFFGLSKESSSTHFHLKRQKLRNETHSVTIPQNSKKTDIFSRELILTNEVRSTIKGVVTVRSDDFTEGKLEFPFEHNVN